MKPDSAPTPAPFVSSADVICPCEHHAALVYCSRRRRRKDGPYHLTYFTNPEPRVSDTRSTTLIPGSAVPEACRSALLATLSAICGGRDIREWRASTQKPEPTGGTMKAKRPERPAGARKTKHADGPAPEVDLDPNVAFDRPLDPAALEESLASLQEVKPTAPTTSPKPKPKERAAAKPEERAAAKPEERAAADRPAREAPKERRLHQFGKPYPPDNSFRLGRNGDLPKKRGPAATDAGPPVEPVDALVKKLDRMTLNDFYANVPSGAVADGSKLGAIARRMIEEVRQIDDEIATALAGAKTIGDLARQRDVLMARITKYHALRDKGLI